MTMKYLFATFLCKKQNKLQKLALFETYKLNYNALVAKGVYTEDTPSTSNVKTADDPTEFNGYEVDVFVNEDESDLESLTLNH